MSNRTRRAPQSSERETDVAVVAVSNVDGQTVVGRTNTDHAPTRVDIRDSTYRIGDVVDSKYKRVGG